MLKPMLKPMVSMVLLSVMAVVPGYANELGDANQALCDKVKSCAIAQMQGQEMTQEVRDMMEPMLESMCANLQGKVDDVPEAHPLYSPAVACVKSMSELSCEEMENAQDRISPACQEFEALAREAGEDI